MYYTNYMINLTFKTHNFLKCLAESCQVLNSVLNTVLGSDYLCTISSTGTLQISSQQVLYPQSCPVHHWTVHRHFQCLSRIFPLHILRFPALFLHLFYLSHVSCEYPYFFPVPLFPVPILHCVCHCAYTPHVLCLFHISDAFPTFPLSIPHFRFLPHFLCLSHISGSYHISCVYPTFPRFLPHFLCLSHISFAYPTLSMSIPQFLFLSHNSFAYPTIPLHLTQLLCISHISFAYPTTPVPIPQFNCISPFIILCIISFAYTTLPLIYSTFEMLIPHIITDFSRLMSRRSVRVGNVIQES